jgi:hypothetical protein
MRKHEELLQHTRKAAFTDTKLQVVYSRSNNMRDLLVKGKINPKIKDIRNLCQPCYKPCATCPRMNTSLNVTHDRITYPLRGQFNCQSHNIVYLLQCNICDIKYVGETSNTINTRCRGHESAIRLEQDNPVAKHYNRASHNHTSYAVTVLDKEENKNRRLRLEEAWMTILSTLQPTGLNKKF